MNSKIQIVFSDKLANMILIRLLTVCCICLCITCLTTAQLTDRTQHSFDDDLILVDKLVDFDGDGEEEYFKHMINGVYYYKGHGNGTFGEIINLSISPTINNVQVGDVDGDGDQDIVAITGASTQQELVYLENEGDHQYTRTSYVLTDIQLASSISLVDINGGGQLSILVSDTGADAVFAVQFDDNQIIETLLVSFVNPDRVVSGRDTAGVSMIVYHSNNKLSKFNIDSNLVLTNNWEVTDVSNLRIIELIDVNDDTILDLVSAEQFRAYLRIGNSDGTMAGRQTITNTASARAVTAYDIDDDSDIDLVFANYSDYHLSLARNNGDNSFSAEEIEMDNRNGHTIQLRDFQNNGSLDAIWNPY